MDGDPIERARQWWDQGRGLILQYPDIDYWEGYNEPIIQTPELVVDTVTPAASLGARLCESSRGSRSAAPVHDVWLTPHKTFPSS